VSGSDQHLPASDGFYYGKGAAAFPLDASGSPRRLLKQVLTSSALKRAAKIAT